MKELNLFCFITNICIALLLGGLMPIIPALTRKSLLFGVRIPAEAQDSPEAKGLRKRYTAVCLAGAAAVLALCIVQYAALPDMTLLGTMYFPFLFVGVQAAAYIPNWKRAARLKAERGWAAPNASFADTGSSHSRGTLSELPWGWYIAGVVLIVISAAVTLVQYPSMPDRIPTHFNANMQPDAWADKSLWVVLMTPLINLVTLAVMWLTGAMFVKAKLQIDAANPALSFAQHRLYRRKMGHGLGALALSIVVMFLLIGFNAIWPMPVSLWLILALCLLPAAWLVVISVRSGQGGFKLKPKVMEEARPAAVPGAPGRGDDQYWVLGLFYCNPDDPANIVEDRFGFNLGFNFARVPVRAGAVLLLLALVGGYAWLTPWLLSILQ